MNRLFLLLFGAVSLVAHAQVPDYVPTEGLVGWYPFNGNANDESGNEQNGEIFGAQLTFDRFASSESAYSFNHTRIEIENSATNDQFKTISFWFMSSSPDGNQVAFKQNIYVDHVYERVSCAIQWNGTHFAGKEVCGAGWQYDNVSSELNDGIWHHYVGILDSAQKRLYIDGNLLDESDFNPENMCSGGDLIIGQEWDGVPYAFIGDLDDFGFWNRALTEEEILALYNAPAPGCTDSAACNYNEEANEDDGTCTYPPFGLADCEAGGALCGEGTIWDASLQICVGFDDCPADLNGNGLVEVSDLLMVLADFGTECAPPVAEWTCGDPVSYHGYDYATVQIGEQCWFAENLRTELYSNGDTIPGNLSNEEWASTTEGAQAISIYGDALEMFGRAYNGYAVGDERGLCLSGWHVALDSEWKELEMELGMSEADANSGGWRGTDQGIQMKTTTGWSEGENGTNSSGFSAKPAGNRTSQGHWTNTVHNAFFWTPASSTGSASLFRHLRFEEAGVFRGNYGSGEGLSIRCLKD